MTKIVRSVGHGGVNLYNDVIIIQKLLNKQRLPGVTGELKYDGDAGKETITRIEIFQKNIVKMEKPDGRIDPGGRTMAKLVETTQSKSSVLNGDSAKWSQDKKIESLTTDLRPKVKAVLSALEQRGFKPTVYYGWRSVTVQLQLYKSGNSKVKFSFHNAQKQNGTPNSYAADIIDSRYAWSKEAETSGFWKALGEEAKKLKLYWGGDWSSFRDWAHIQLVPNSKLSEIKKESGL